MNAKCLIIDDEPLAIEVIQNYIEKVGNIDVVCTCSCATDAFSILQKKQIDLLFLDIQMPGLTGIEFLRTLRNPPKVILVTAYREFALEGYELDIIDYLLKPVSFERFLKAVNKYFEMSNNNDLVVVNHTSSESEESYIYIKSNKKVFKILLKHIQYVESLKDYIKVYIENRKPIVAKQTLQSIEAMLPAKKFLRIHRSYIVSIDLITGFTATAIELNDIELPIGRNYKQQVFSQLNYKQLND
jgi:DNA-binding LytR/AlgR family response regulator